MAWIWWTSCKSEEQVKDFGASYHTWSRHLSKDLMQIDKGNDEEQIKVAIDKPIRPHDNVKWVISFKKDQAKCRFMSMINWLDEKMMKELDDMNNDHRCDDWVQ